MVEIVALIVLGLFAGAIAASLGLGGGIIFVPALVVLFSFDQHIAQGTSLAVIFPTAIVATVAHARRGNVRWRLAIPIGTAGIAGAVVGAQIALHLNPDL
ncbi:MAG: sulfite exporter TauE/SafE family protein, partial [Acidimicrobiia bacterium]